VSQAGAKRTLVLRVGSLSRQADLIRQAADILRRGGLVAFPTETVYGLGCRADDEQAVRRLFAAKGRPPTNPLLLHLPEAARAERYVSQIPPEARRLMEVFWPGPLTLLLPRSDQVLPIVTANLDKVGLRLPSHPLAQEFLRQCEVPVVATSANLSGRPSPTTPEHVLADLEGRIDCLLEWREPPLGLESTVLDLASHPPRIVRLGFVTAEEIARVLGRAPLLSGDVATPERFTRFAPEARVVVVEGDPERVARRLKGLFEVHSSTEKVAILCTRETAETHLAGLAPLRVMGSRQDLEGIARELFGILRELETQEQARLILVEGLEREGLGATIMERLCRVAHQVINTEDPGYAGQGGLRPRRRKKGK
jgi:L-threonylcarbamoyladenylate synthase